MHLIWEELRVALPMILHGNPYLLSIIGFTLQVAVVATASATVIGLPIALALALGRFRGPAVPAHARQREPRPASRVGRGDPVRAVRARRRRSVRCA